jgi:hypothetical protein
MFIVYGLVNCKTHVTYIFDVNNGKLLDRERQMTDPVLSSERAPLKDKTANFRKQPSDRKYYLVTSPRMGSIP